MRAGIFHFALFTAYSHIRKLCVLCSASVFNWDHGRPQRTRYFTLAASTSSNTCSAHSLRRLLVRPLAQSLGCSLLLLSLTLSPLHGASSYRIASFSADVTVPMGHGMMGGSWLSRKVADPLEAHGIVILSDTKPIVFVAVDWCEIRNDAFARWQTVLAEAANTSPDHVMLCALHQHDAPVADLRAEHILRSRKLAGTVCDTNFHETAVQRVAEALRKALPNARPFTAIGLGQAKVEKVASNRRFIKQNGSVSYNRMSRTTDPEAIAADEGLIDPWLKTLSFWNGNTPLVALSSYATHPMSHYGEGEVSADFPGLARRRRQQDNPAIHQIYFTGCAGNITAGKYNNGSRANRTNLANRLYSAMTNAWSSTKTFPVTNLTFRTESIQFDSRNDPDFTVAGFEKQLIPQTRPFAQCLAAMGLSWRERNAAGKPIQIPCIDLGFAQWLVLPGEAYVEFQLAAQKLRPDSFVLVAGYGDAPTGYIPTAQHISEHDGNLHDWSWVSPTAETKLMQALKKLLTP